MSLLEVKNLKVHFPVKHGMFSRVRESVKAVDDVSFSIAPGETLGLVGESGCGGGAGGERGPARRGELRGRAGAAAPPERGTPCPCRFLDWAPDVDAKLKAPNTADAEV